MVKVVLQGKRKKFSINAMIDSGATEDFIDREVCQKHQIRTIATENRREIYLAHGNASDMGPVTHIAKVPMTIGNHQELATLQVANFQNHEVILKMPWLKGHNPKIDWGKNKMTFDSERCTTWCLDRKSFVYGIWEARPQEENLITRFSEIHIQNEGLRVKEFVSESRIPTKESLIAATHDLYAQATKKFPAKEQATIGTGIAIGLPPDSFERIAPRSGLGAKYPSRINAGVIDVDYTGEVKIILVNLGDQDYQVQKGDKIAHLIVERSMNEEIVLVKELDTTGRGTKEFGSSDKEMNKQVGTGADLLTNQFQKVTIPTDHRRGYNPPKIYKIPISEIRQKQFHQAYRNGETTGIVKFSPKENQIYFRKINISAELAIQNKEGQRTKVKKEDFLESLVPRKYHNL